MPPSTSSLPVLINLVSVDGWLPELLLLLLLLLLVLLPELLLEEESPPNLS